MQATPEGFQAAVSSQANHTASGMSSTGYMEGFPQSSRLRASRTDSSRGETCDAYANRIPFCL